MTGDTCRCGQRGAGSHGRSPHSDRAADGVALPRGCRFIAWRDVEEAICQVLRVGLRVLSGSCVLARRSWADHGDNHEQRLCNVPRFLGRPLSRMQAWTIGRAASEHAGVQVLALRPSQHGERNEPAPIHPPPVPTRTRASDRAPDQEPRPCPAPGWLVAPPDRLPDCWRCRGARAHAASD
jgi:hypothetical protein